MMEFLSYLLNHFSQYMYIMQMKYSNVPKRNAVVIFIWNKRKDVQETTDPIHIPVSKNISQIWSNLLKSRDTHNAI